MEKGKKRKAVARKIEIAQVRRAIADYMQSEGCSCCRMESHSQHAQVLAKMLKVPAFRDGSGYQFHKFVTPKKKK